MPNRILRDWTDSDKIEMLSPEAERLFVRLIMKADDFGRFHADPRLVTAACLPLVRQVTVNLVNAWLDEIRKARIIDIYEVEGRKYLQINNFSQRTRQTSSRFPGVDGQLTVNGRSIAHVFVDGDGDGDVCGDGKRAPDLSINQPKLEDCIAASATLAMRPADVEAFFHHYNSIGWVDAQKRPIKSLPSALAKWKANEANFKRKGVEPNTDEWQKAYREIAESIWRAQADNYEGGVKRAMQKARDSYNDIPKKNGMDVVSAAITMAMNNSKPSDWSVQ